MSGLSKNPRRPAGPLELLPEDVSAHDGQLWRIHSTGGLHPIRFGEARTFGPLTHCRWEPHPEPLGEHAGFGVLYTASDADTAFAEVFQTTRVISCEADRTLSGWLPTRPLDLLDLTRPDWLLRHGASASLTAQPRSVTRAWTRAIHRQLGSRLDGLLVPSTMTGAPMAVLFTHPGREAWLPSAPAFARSLDTPEVTALAVNVAARWGWDLA